MSPEQWQRVQEIFLQAEDTHGPQRVALLDCACAGDLELRRRVEAMLAASVKSVDFLELAVGAAAGGFVGSLNSAPCETIGPYRLVRRLGSGGMGEVYLATRADRQFEKQTAIKVMRAGLDTPDLRSRFRSERQILARLEHPNIARLLDGGALENGLPYVVMEYVEGLPVTDYAAAHALSTNQRLKLFITICDAVEYAHRNLVAHRDIKPANILVTSEGVPKLLDFGIAKLVSSDAGETDAPTRLAERLMTPEFASPEQIRGEAVNTSTDIYSLGALLYILLTGLHPYKTRDLSPAQLERLVCEQDPERPSAAVLRGDLPPEAARRLSRELAGDLDHIVAKAMRKESAARYGSTGLLIEDLRRYLEGYPVTARKGVWMYGAAKFVRRHRLGVAAAAVFAFVVLAFAGAMAVLAHKVGIERDTAERERRAEQQVSNFLVNLFGAANTNESRGKPLTARDLLDHGVEAVDRDLGAQPVVHAKLLDTMGKAYESLGIYSMSEPLLEKGLAIRRGIGGGHTLEVAQSLKDVAETYRLLSKYAQAEAAARESLSIRRELLGSQNVDVAESVNTLGLILWQKGDPAGAEPFLREALAIRTRLEGPESLGAAVYMSNLGGVLRAKSDLHGAEELYRRVLELRRKQLGEDHPRTALAMNGLALVLASRGNYDESEKLFRRTLALRRESLGEDHPEVAATMTDLAMVLQGQGRYAGAEALYRKALAYRIARFGEDSRESAASFNELGSLLEETGKYDEALSLNNRSLEIRRKVMGERSVWYARSMADTAQVLLDRGELAQAEALARESLEIRRATLGSKHMDTARGLLLLARVVERRGDTRRAEDLYRQSLSMSAAALDKDHPQRAETLTALGALLLRDGRARNAEPLLREALAIRQKRLPAGHPATAATAGMLSACLLKLGPS